MERQVDKQHPNPTNRNEIWVSLQEETFPRSGQYGRDAYRSRVMGLQNKSAEIRTLYSALRLRDNTQALFPPKLHYIHFWNTHISRTIPKSAGIKTAIQELKDLFCNSFKRK